MSIVDWNQIGGAATAVGVIGGLLYKLWSSIRNKFDAQDTARALQLTTIKTDVLTAFSKHEILDQERHADNLKKFDKQDTLLTDIRLDLARAGLNGHDKHEANDSC